jgi:hypothetical protein
VNNALIAIGIYSPYLKDRAIRAAEEIGKVEVDHAGTYCKTRDARSYIQNHWDYEGEVICKRCGTKMEVKIEEGQVRSKLIIERGKLG